MTQGAADFLKIFFSCWIPRAPSHFSSLCSSSAACLSGISEKFAYSQQQGWSSKPCSHSSMSVSNRIVKRQECITPSIAILISCRIKYIQTLPGLVGPCLEFQLTSAVQCCPLCSPQSATEHQSTHTSPPRAVPCQLSGWTTANILFLKLEELFLFLLNKNLSVWHFQLLHVFTPNLS